VSASRVGADTEALDNPSLRSAAEQIKTAIQAYEAGVAGVGQVVLHHRNSDVDEYVTKLVTQAPQTTKGLLTMIQRAGEGDVGAAKDMADFFAKVEESATTEAGAGGNTNPH
jgi:hypothetical protein